MRRKPDEPKVIKHEKIAAVSKYVDYEQSSDCIYRLSSPLKYREFDLSVAEQNTWFVLVEWEPGESCDVYRVHPCNGDGKRLGREFTIYADSPEDALDYLGYELVEPE